jgi:small-conductance mechanosensitive channel
VHKLIEYFLLKVEEEQRKMYKEVDLSQLNLASDFLKAVVWLIAILLLFSNLGIDITALLTGLGIAGIAVAFAMQNILADIFASFSIYFDKPFRKGDFIVVGNESGTIKKIGLKTTRIESLSGEEIVISNRQLVDSIVHNYKRMDYRRVKFRFGVTYDTDVKKLEKIPAYVKEIIEKIEKDGKKIATLDRVHFFNFGDSALEYEVMYTVHSSDYKTYMDVQQEINLKLIKKFKKEGIEFAYPTQTIYLKREN